MAVFVPTLEDIQKNLQEKPTQGEWKLLQILSALDDTYEVYFQSHLNVAHPDIIIMKQGIGIFIIEVKDWELDSYSFVPESQGMREYLQLKNEPAHITTPFQQVINYKDDLYECISPLLYEQKLNDNKKSYGIVRTGVYFSKATTSDVNRLFSDSKKISNEYGYKKYDKYILFWTSTDTDRFISNQISKWLSNDRGFKDETYQEIKNLLAPSEELAEQAQPFELSAQQNEFAKCIHDWKRVRGMAGSGKTLVIAQKAINCYLEKKTPVLILTFNITLRNYIRDKISRNTRGWPSWKRAEAFEIIHFDGFLPQMLRKYELEVMNIDDIPDDSSDEKRWDILHDAEFEALKAYRDHIEKYQTILIDEAQDYKTEWFKNIEDLFLAPDADFLVVADEKQNIYGREVDKQKLPVVPGKKRHWLPLKGTYRMAPEIAEFAWRYQNALWQGKYEIEPYQQPSFFDEAATVRYIWKNDQMREDEYILEQIEALWSQEVSRNDVCVMTTSFERLRSLDAVIRKKYGNRSTTTMGESLEVYKAISAAYDAKRCQKELNKYRRMKKRNFEMNTGTTKISTIHSFKGWEISHAIIVIENEDKLQKAIEQNELIYTAITRAKRGLIIINLGNEKYHSFLSEIANDNSSRVQIPDDRYTYSEISGSPVPV